MEKASLKDPVGRIRIVGWIEALSYLLLLAAMPWKYWGGNEIGVKIMGPIHGGLFVLLGLLVLIAWLDTSLPFRHAVLVMVASVLPLGPFFIDRRLSADERKAGADS
ncbi:MAG: DUF3817 domain-containing protein [Verrucomicrobiales bacterium]